jgi:O-antigen ligase
MIAAIDNWILRLRHDLLHSDSIWLGLSTFVVLLLPLVAAYWNGQGKIRYAALPLTLLALVLMIAALDIRNALTLWLLAWLCVALSFVKLPPVR